MYKTYRDFIVNGPTAKILSDYYYDHTLNECAEYFNVSCKSLRKVFVYYGIKLRSKSETDALINGRKRSDRIASYSYIDIDEFKKFYYIETNEQIRKRFNIKSDGDLLTLVEY